MAKHKRTTAAGATETLTDNKKMYVELLKGAFLEALGEKPIFEIQQRNPKDKSSGLTGYIFKRLTGLKQNGKIGTNQVNTSPITL